MPANERQVFKLATKRYFFEQTHETMLLPAMLDILVDQIGVDSEHEKEVEYSRFLARCSKNQYMDCNNCCNVNQRVFFIYKDWHKNIFLNRNEINRYHRILIKELSDEEKNNLNNALASSPDPSKMIIKACAVFNCYINRKWEDRCVCPLDNYMDVLMVAFFFNSNILYWAIRKELERKNKDMYIIHAIRTCLDLCVFAYMMSMEYNKDNSGKVITKYINFHHVRAIEDVVLINDENDKSNQRVVEALNDTGVAAINNICIRMKGSLRGNWRLIKLIGRKNYKFLKKYCKVYGFND